MRKDTRRSHAHAGKRDKRLPMLISFAALLTILVLIMPKEPVVIAVNAAGGSAALHKGLVISEVMTDNVGAFPDEMGRFGDWFELKNTTDQPMNLSGIGASDRSDRIKFLFPDMVLEPGGFVIVFCDNTHKDDPKGVLHAKFKLSSLGDSLFLFDTSGIALEYVVTPTLNADESFARMEDGSFQKTFEYSPGYENTFEGHSLYLANYYIEPDVLMLNEIMAAPRSGLRDEDDELSDWIELRSRSDKDIPLGNLALSDDEGKPVKWVFPKDAVIPAGGYYLVFCSGKNKMESKTGIPHSNFSISAERETIILSTLSGELIDRVVIDNLGKDLSYGRDPETLKWKVYTLATPGEPNNQAGANKADNYLRAINKTNVFISEVISSANNVIAIAGQPASDAVELYNAGTTVVDMSGWGLSDNINWPRKWTFPQGVSIWPGEYKVVLLDGSTNPGSDGSKLHASFSLSRKGGEILTLSDATGRVLDRLYVPEIPSDVSYGRTLGVGGFFYYDIPTFGKANGSGFYGFAAAPSFTVPGGLYKGTLDTSINVPEGTVVRYTTDGSVPTLQNGTLYDGKPIHVKDNTILRARAFQQGMEASTIATASYLMNTYHKLRVVSLVCDPDELYNEQTGLLTEGPDIDKSNSVPFKNAIYRLVGKEDRIGYVEIFDVDTGEAIISQGIKMDLMGDYSLDMPQKSFKVRAQAGLGEKYFNYPLFEDREYETYKSFTLRNSGNDCVWTRLADLFQTRLVDRYLDVDLLTLAGEPVVVYLNGFYWGHYNMRERKDRFSIAQYEGLPEEQSRDITILRGNGSVVQGSAAEYRAMIKKLKTSNPATNDADLQYLLDNIDVNNYMDWFAVEMFFGNSDPGNIMYYKLPTAGSKWKCLLFDLDYGMYNSVFDSPASYMRETGMGQQKIDNTIFRKILEVPYLKDIFLTKLGLVYQTLTAEVMMEVRDELVALLETEMVFHFNRWAELNDKKINIDSPLTPNGNMDYWHERLLRQRDTIYFRPYELYPLIQTQYKLTDAQMLSYFGTRPEKPTKMYNP